MVHREIARQVATADSESASQFYVTLTSVYVPYTCRSESQISPTVAYARTASMMYGMVFADETLPFDSARGSWAAALFSASRRRCTSSVERRSRRSFSLADCCRAPLLLWEARRPRRRSRCAETAFPPKLPPKLAGPHAQCCSSAAAPAARRPQSAYGSASAKCAGSLRQSALLLLDPKFCALRGTLRSLQRNRYAR